MAQFLPSQEVLKAAQDEAIKLFDATVQQACTGITKIQDNSKQQMEQAHSELAGDGKALEKKLTNIQDQAMKEIDEMQKATEKNVLGIWDSAKAKIVSLAQTIGDPERNKAIVDEMNKQVTSKIKEFNQVVKKHADEVKKKQKEYFNEMKKRVSK